MIFLLAVLTVIFVRSSLGEYNGQVRAQLAGMPGPLFAGVLACGCAYTVLEGTMNRMLAGCLGYRWSWPSAVFNAFYTAFYRGITMGSGSLPAMMVDADRKGIPPEHSFGIYETQYCIHRGMLLVFAAFFLLVHPALSKGYLKEYVPYVLAGAVISAIVILVLIGACVWEPFHRLVKRGFDRLGERWPGPWESGKQRLDCLRQSARDILRNPYALLKGAGIEAVKISCWYLIPWLVCRGLGQEPALSLLDSFTILSMVTVLIGVIPTPGNMASIEMIYVMLMTPVVGAANAGTGMLVYRFATFYGPFLAGCLLAVLRKAGRAFQKGKKG